jgi:hypothetical protein
MANYDDDVNYRGSASDYLAEQQEYDADARSEGSDPFETLVNWLQSAPPGSEWTDEGQDASGQVLACYDGIYWDKPYTVRFHVHGGAAAPAFGNAWVEGWPNVQVSIQNQLTNRDNLKGVVRDVLGWDIA